MTTLRLIGKPDCHLCEVADEIVELVAAELPSEIADSLTVERASILDDPSLYELWWEKVPVVLIDDELHAHWRLSADRLRAALLEAHRRSADPSAVGDAGTAPAHPRPTETKRASA